MKRLIPRICILLAIILILPGTIVGILGSGQLLSPARRTLQDYHRDILANQTDHGLQVIDDHFSGTPVQIYRPIAAPGIAEKSRAIRTILTKREVSVPHWGKEVGTIVMLHGHQGRKEDHLPIAERFCAVGFVCIGLDLPGQGDHPVEVARFGKTEVALIKELAQTLREKHQLPQPTALFGISQGGAITLQAAAADPARYYAAASVASFTSLDAILHRNATNMFRSPKPIADYLTGSVRLATFLRAGYDPAEISPIEAAASIQVPTLIGHGAADGYIPPEHGQLIFDRIPHQKKELHLIAGGTHNNVLAVGGNEFYADIASFFLIHLPPR